MTLQELIAMRASVAALEADLRVSKAQTECYRDALRCLFDDLATALQTHTVKVEVEIPEEEAPYVTEDGPSAKRGN
jgi:hypothetical protein